eukprot:560937-Amphidinium_carterae.1
MDRECAHSPHNLEPAPWECSLQAVCRDIEVRDCDHRSDAALREFSLEAVVGDTKYPDCAHQSDDALRKCSFEAVRIYLEFLAQGPHRLEPVLRERSLKAVCAYTEVHDCAHRSDATFWKCSFKTIRVN